MTIKDLKKPKPNYSQEEVNERINQSIDRMKARKKAQYESAIKTLSEFGEYRNIKKMLNSAIDKI